MTVATLRINVCEGSLIVPASSQGPNAEKRFKRLFIRSKHNMFINSVLLKLSCVWMFFFFFFFFTIAVILVSDLCLYKGLTKTGAAAVGLRAAERFEMVVLVQGLALTFLPVKSTNKRR